MFGLFKTTTTQLFRRVKKTQEREQDVVSQEIKLMNIIMKTFLDANAKGIHTKESISFADKHHVELFIRTINALYVELETLKKYELALIRLAKQVQQDLEPLRAHLGEESNYLTNNERTTIQYIQTTNWQINTLLDEIITLQKFDFETVLNLNDEHYKCIPKDVQNSIKIKKQILKIDEQIRTLQENIIHIKELEEQTKNGLKRIHLN